ncbi:MAG TPA: TIGR04255 family protein [Mycobacterium sp.]
MFTRFVYPNDALALVLVELRHPPTEPPARPELAVLKEMLSQWAPILEREEGRQFNIGTGEQVAFSMPKLVARDRHIAITFRPDAMTLEMTDYPGWQAFKKIITAMVVARQDVAPVDGCVRVGLRYINEVRAPLGGHGWSEWVVDSLLGPQDQLAELKLIPSAQQHVVQCGATDAGDTLTLRYGAAKGVVIPSTPTLQRLKEPSGQEEDFFLIDIDSAWADSRNHVPPLDSELVDATAQRLHEPIGPLFESLIKPDLRTKVLQQPGKE